MYGFPSNALHFFFSFAFIFLKTILPASPFPMHNTDRWQKLPLRPWLESEAILSWTLLQESSRGRAIHVFCTLSRIVSDLGMTHIVKFLEMQKLWVIPSSYAHCVFHGFFSFNCFSLNLVLNGCNVGVEES